MKKLLAISAMLVLAFGVSWAMGSKPAAPKEEPKYKLEILKMEIVPTYEITPETTTSPSPPKKVKK